MSRRRGACFLLGFNGNDDKSVMVTAVLSVHTASFFAESGPNNRLVVLHFSTEGYILFSSKSGKFEACLR